MEEISQNEKEKIREEERRKIMKKIKREKHVKHGTPTTWLDKAFKIEISMYRKYDPRIQNANDIRDPVLQIVHRWIASVIRAHW